MASSMKISHDIRREHGGTTSAPVEETIDYVPFRSADVVRYMLHADRIHRWAPVAPALYHLALVQGTAVRLWSVRKPRWSGGSSSRPLHLSPGSRIRTGAGHSGGWSGPPKSGLLKSGLEKLGRWPVVEPSSGLLKPGRL